MRATAFIAALCLSTASAQAGAWTLPRGHWQLFSDTIESEASRSFDAHSGASIPTTYNKLLVQNYFEYGLTNAITLFVTPVYVRAKVQTPTVPLTSVQNTSLQAGARLMLYAGLGRLSLEGSYKTAGAFDLSVSAHNDSGRQIELRLLYGTSFKLFGRDGFADVQVAERWISHPRPNETPFDITAGLWVSRDTMILAQSFNVISGGNAIPPYTYYRAHKLELSLVEKLSRHWSLQLGAFYSPAGQNALVERGLALSLWTQD